MIAEQTKASRSSQQIQALRIHRDSLLPSEPTLTPLVPDPSPINWQSVRELEAFATSEETRDARTAMRFIRQMGGR